MILLDLFSGYGGFHLGLQQAGFKFKKTYFSEKDKHCIANYRYNFSEAEYLGPVENVPGSGIKADVITFGSPCQDFSLAGKRAGLEGSRSSLIEYAIEYIRRFRPAVFIWENVKGAFSSGGGADFWAIVQAFTNIGGYQLQWGLVNTLQWLPQNRERIFLVGLARAGSGCQIFPLGESDGGIDEGTTEAATVRTLTAGGHSGGHHSGMTLIRHRSDQPYQAGHVAPTLRNSDKAEVRIVQRSRGNNKGGEHSDCPTLSANSFEHNNHVVVSEATKQGYAIAEEGDSINFSVPNSKTRRGRAGKGVAQTLDTQCNQGVIQVNPSTESGGKQPYQQNRVYDANGVIPALQAQLTSGSHAIKLSQKDYSKGNADAERVYDANGIARTLKGDAGGGGAKMGLYEVKHQQDKVHSENGTMSCLAVGSHGNSAHLTKTKIGQSIRRLTPTECERLQGLPDSWLKYGNYDGEIKVISDSQRYKMAGNGVSIPPVREIGKQILTCA